MWKYNYAGVSDDPDSLMHWKYIKRYKKNGKWRYIYKTNQLKADFDRATGRYQKERYENAKDRKSELLDNVRSDHSNLNSARTNQREAWKKVNPKSLNTLNELKADYYREDFNAGSGRKKTSGKVSVFTERTPKGTGRDGVRKVKTKVYSTKDLVSLKTDAHKTNGAIRNAWKADDQLDNAKTEFQNAKNINNAYSKIVNATESEYKKTLAYKIDKGKEFVDKLLKK